MFSFLMPNIYVDESDGDIPLPSDLPPGTELVTSDDEITMPDGPPPGAEGSHSNSSSFSFLT